MPHRTSDYPDDLVYGVARRFLDGQKTSQILEAVTKRYPMLFSADAPFTRERVYPTVREAIRREFIQLIPPVEEALRDALIKRSANKGELQVLDVLGGAQTSQEVAAAARTVLDLIMQLSKERRGPVHIGLGIGQSNKHFTKTLGALLRSHIELPKLVVHALTTDHAHWNPMENPISYVSYLRDALPGDHLEFVGLRAMPFFEEERVATQYLYHDALERKGEIDIVVSSIASSLDHDGYLKRYLKEFNWAPEAEGLVKQGWVGDMMLCPYSAEEALTPEGRRPVTLFSLPELVEMAHSDDKHVVLMVAACGHCGEPKVDALRPLLDNPALHAWNHLIVDQTTAREVLR